jgi:protein farnesyltransferase subunit beta
MKNNGTEQDGGDSTKYGEASKVRTTIKGSFDVHDNGEMDMRGVYCALIVADILGFLEEDEELKESIGDFIGSCQTYEGGISCYPYGEAHGGYTFCGLASLILLGQTDKIDLNRCLEWLKNRQ